MRRKVLSASAFILLLGVSSSAQSDTPGQKYLETVRGYADAMVEHGRDVYGEVQSPVFASALDRETMRIPEDAPPSIEGIRANDRALFGGNPMHDECFYMLLYELSRTTGDAKYAEAADAALKHFFQHAQSPATGLMAWGEHMFLDFRTETMGGLDIHEFYRPWVLFDESYRVAPEAMAAFARGVWEHQIGDHEAGLFSRHAKWSEHKADTGNEFPRHGGFYFAQWAEAYKHTNDEVFLKAISTLLDYFERARHPESGALPNANPAGGKKVVMWTQSQLAQAIDLEEGAKKVPDDLAARMRETARRNDDSYLRLDHSAEGLLHTASYETLETESRCGMWGSGYGQYSDAGTAMICYERYLQTGAEGYRNLIVDTARRYVASEPDASIELYPYTLGDAIFLMVAAHRITAETVFLERAQHFADIAVPMFWDNGPLPRASSQKSHFESITRADTLARALLLLWGELNDTLLETRYIDR